MLTGLAGHSGAAHEVLASLSAIGQISIWRGIRVQLLIEIKRTARLIERALDELGERGLMPERQRRALEYLDRSGNCPCISDVARHLRISRQAAQRLAIRLERAGFVAFVRYDDFRLVQLRLTQRGWDALRLAGGKVIGLLCSITEGLENDTLETTAAVLRAMQDRIHRPPRYEE